MRIGFDRGRMVYVVQTWKLHQPMPSGLIEWMVVWWNKQVCFFLGHDLCGDIDCGGGVPCKHCVWCCKEVK
jgi:hypothetical protein